MPNRSVVIFDLDGTITEPYLDFDTIRAKVGVEGPILEAMEAGLLVFGPMEGGLPAYIEDGENGYLMDTSSAKAIAKKLTGVLLAATVDHEALRKAATRGSEMVREKLSIDASAAQLGDLYSALLS